jgi:hypothetical protein
MRFDQSWKPSSTDTTRAVTRSRSSARRIEPSTIALTPRSSPISRESRAPLACARAITIPRPHTRSPGVIESTSMRSSVSPSARYASPGAPALRNGSTATVLVVTAAGRTWLMGPGVDERGPVISASAPATSPALWNRSAFAFAMQRSTTSAACVGRSGRSRRGSGGGSMRRRDASQKTESPCQARAPVSIS